MPRTARFSRDDWAEAAFLVLCDSGPAAVAVEPVAARLGASKSSFYWLFENRQSLLEAALERWEQHQTAAVHAALSAVTDPAERLRMLVRHAHTATQGADLALRLLTESADPVVRPVVERVTRRRLAIIEAAFAELGRPADQARHFASMTYAAYLGLAALRRVDAAPADHEEYIADLLAAFGVAP
ncbi:TetR family transcriptional regulator [Streptomyces filipinensis]|uniref:TetR family transcriptional regulator n=1 Tax=Streptomyces filipinensis TaxID=66887 RepID=A0A918MAH4_9ACTN|nr:TetR family transcriptional regulator [Streptomyces filipinensis]GGU92632.1 TetR family transcriptional regulator [Streptomyces filipinensis]